MKNVFKAFGIVALAAIVISMAACPGPDGGGGGNANVVGTWKGTYADAGFTVTITIVLNANGTWDNSNEMVGTTFTNSGTYTVQGNTIYATSTGGYLQTWTVTGNTMRVPMAGANGSQGGTATLRKQ
jgi:hypothetical protein